MNKHSLNTEYIFSLCINSIQELDTRVSSLENHNVSLENQISLLKNYIKNME